MHNITTHWFQFGDTCSKTFFNYHKGGHRKVFVKKLIVDGKILTIQVEFNEYVRKIYENLYSADLEDDAIRTTKVECFILIPHKVSKNMNYKLVKDITLDEMKVAINSFSKGKVTRLDGLPMEFFQEILNETSLALLEATKAMLEACQFSKFFNKGLIVLIPKSRNRSLIGNWKPITLLGSV
jgi:hypothetical protein